MKKLLIVFILITSLFSADKAMHIAFYGDSITADGRYITNFINMLPFKAHIATFAKPGALTKETYYDVMGSVTKGSFDYIVIFTGINSIDRPQYVISLLEKMYKRCSESGAQVIAITLSPWKDYNSWTAEKQMNTYMVNGFITSMPKNVDIVVNIYSMLEDKNNPGAMKKDYTSDGLHPNAEGHRIIGQTLFYMFIQ